VRWVGGGGGSGGGVDIVENQVARDTFLSVGWCFGRAFLMTMLAGMDA
jgi:hypothetical protein